MSNWTPSVYKGDILDDDIHKIINASIKSDKIYSENVDKRLSSIIRLGAGVSSSAGVSYRASTKASAYVSADTNIDINDKVIYISDDEEEEKKFECLKIPIYKYKEQYDNYIQNDIKI